MVINTLISEAMDAGCNAELHPCFVVFDMVYLDGKSIADASLEDRYNLLTKTIKPKSTFFEILPHEVKHSAEDISNSLNEHMLRSEEGIMLKDPLASYSPGLEDSTWIKIKPEYISTLSDDVDVILVAGYYGSGRRRGKLSSFTCAVIDDEWKGETPRYLTFCDFGSGLQILIFRL